MAFDRQGNLYVSNYAAGIGTTVRKFSSTGTDLGVFASTGLSGPQGLAFDALGNLYVANFTGGNVRKFSSSGADLGDIITGLSNPAGLLVDSKGSLYVSQYYRNKVITACAEKGIERRMNACEDELDKEKAVVCCKKQTTASSKEAGE